MLNAQTLAALARAGVTQADLNPAVGGLPWSQLHETRKKLRRGSESVMSAMPANGENIPADLGAAYEAIGAQISRISDEIDRREASGDREPSATAYLESLAAPRRQQLAAARAEAARATPIGGGSLSRNWRPGSPLVLGPNDSAVRAYGAPEEEFGALFRAALLGDFSGLSPAASQIIGTGAGGGFLVPTQHWGTVLDLARAKMRIREAGATIIDTSQMQVGATEFPTLEEDPTAHWRGELQDIDASAAVFGSRKFQAQTVACFVSGSVEALEDAVGLGQMVMDSMAAQIAQQVDYAALAGNGVGRPLGVLNHAAIQTVDAGGVLTDYDPFARAIQKCREVNVEPGAFILSPSTMGHIDRLADTTGQPLQPPPSLRDRRFLDTNNIDRTDTSPTQANAVTGEWSSLFAVFRQNMVLEISRTAGDSFQKLGWKARAYARVDAFPVRPGRFCKIVNLPAN